MKFQEALGKVVETVITLERAGSKITSVSVDSEKTNEGEGEYDFTPVVWIASPSFPGMDGLLEEDFTADGDLFLQTIYSAKCNGCEIHSAVFE
uniref:Uncharacterized protein n=1 Tax=Candidatus Kentrum sp. UNK TaxID=2126344 RepID=A0A450ZWZ6_9GAMM|nr:MAG: hypothetical protein BECKUNK1418G_GA0071005_100275 [Candidatus Kentron sp. UNK]VFK68351.1 MAG: hypothetical protein BECKUNK1418H_GA0071006_100175 [Candidatus Kentron sp. UNK]